ncbi:SRPBCC domain-containing protein [Virgibacillus oceani]|uniref:Toxin n=1 Tax=Virgibacillus oceani TaxID=1479511 RepID=A0A917HHZ8_9BACI|nr:SRPBCC domain-containing protein [Virgibacillus oceani]GGG79224.1 toxin [Virgibacillus oceani]
MTNDRIEREIYINASVNTVWELISQPAWWVGDAPGPDKVHVDGSRVVADTKYGKFPVLTEKADPPNYLACRWASSFPGEEPIEGNSTLVEFMLKEKDGGTWLIVVESGFSSLTVSDEEKGKYFKENVQGWKYQLEVLRKRAEPENVIDRK